MSDSSESKSDDDSLHIYYSITPHINTCHYPNNSDEGQVLLCLSGCRVIFENDFVFNGSNVENLKNQFNIITADMNSETIEQFNRIKNNMQNYLDNLITNNFVKIWVPL